MSNPAGLPAQSTGIWISAAELAPLPTAGPAWENLKAAAEVESGRPNLADQNDRTNVCVLAKALVYARTQEERHRQEVIAACRQIMGSEEGGRVLALGRELAAYVIAADLVTLPSNDDHNFRYACRRQPRRHCCLPGRSRRAGPRGASLQRLAR
ncbi:hypothetical protein HUU39_07510 [candidate division KSB1 bacterium]|nr:hypothetical protein [candidate division KSB1 bacterium]